MRILTTVQQIYRVTDLDGGDGHYPAYAYPDAIPREVGRALLANCQEIEWPADRDFLNDDGGYIVIYDRPDELRDRLFGLPPIGELEEVQLVECADGSRWWIGCRFANNELSVDHVFDEAIAPLDIREALMERHEAMADDF